MKPYAHTGLDTDIPTLSEQNRELLDDYLARLPAEARRVVTDAIQTAIEHDGAHDALGEGDRAPDFVLPTPDGCDIQLSELLAAGPVVLSFYRGGWCRFCSLELRALQRRRAAIEALGSRIVAVSPETPAKARRTRSENGVTFDLASDPGNQVASRYGLVFPFHELVDPVYRDWGIDLPPDEHNRLELPLPATYVIARDGVIATAFADPDYTRRMEPSEVIHALRDLSR
jgi:peroxiredoxin